MPRHIQLRDRGEQPVYRRYTASFDVASAESTPLPSLERSSRASWPWLGQELVSHRAARAGDRSTVEDGSRTTDDAHSKPFMASRGAPRRIHERWLGRSSRGRKRAQGAPKELRLSRRAQWHSEAGDGSNQQPDVELACPEISLAQSPDKFWGLQP